jgi:tripartite-type tricarboxylate transporter receptor subunit TctC
MEIILKKILAFLSLCLISIQLQATETIKIYSPYSPGHSATPAMFRIIDEANSSQNIYKFSLEFKPGGNQIIAVKSLDPQNSLAIIAPAFVENLASGQLNEQDYVPVYALGDACWAVVTNKSPKGQREFVVGGVGYGNAAHLTALALSEKYKFSVRYIVFKSNNDALINMAGDNGIEFVIDRFESYENLRSKNPKMAMIAASCPTRLPQAPGVPTLKEIGINAPYIFNIIIAHKDMSRGRQVAITKILEAATDRIGDAEIYKLSAVRPPQFDRVSAEQFYNKSISTVKTLQNKYKTQIEQSKR